jgi:hypothetical protein
VNVVGRIHSLKVYVIVFTSGIHIERNLNGDGGVLTHGDPVTVKPDTRVCQIGMNVGGVGRKSNGLDVVV